MSPTGEPEMHTVLFGSCDCHSAVWEPREKQNVLREGWQYSHCPSIHPCPCRLWHICCVLDQNMVVLQGDLQFFCSQEAEFPTPVSGHEHIHVADFQSFGSLACPNERLPSCRHWDQPMAATARWLWGSNDSTSSIGLEIFAECSPI